MLHLANPVVIIDHLHFTTVSQHNNTGQCEAIDSFPHYLSRLEEDLHTNKRSHVTNLFDEIGVDIRQHTRYMAY